MFAPPLETPKQWDGTMALSGPINIYRIIKTIIDLKARITVGPLPVPWHIWVIFGKTNVSQVCDKGFLNKLLLLLL